MRLEEERERHLWFWRNDRCVALLKSLFFFFVIGFYNILYNIKLSQYILHRVCDMLYLFKHTSFVVYVQYLMSSNLGG